MGDPIPKYLCATTPTIGERQLLDHFQKLLSQSYTERLNFVRWLVVAMIFVILMRSLYLQIFDYSQYSRIVKRKNQPRFGEIQRGAIYDSRGELLAASIRLYSLYANPKEVDNPDDLIRQLDPLLGVSSDDLRQKLHSKKSFVWIKRFLSPNMYQKVRQFKFKGLNFKKEYKRFYPNRFLGSHLLGFVDKESTGKSGVEYKYNDYLLGKHKKGYFPNLIEGAKLYLTLDASIQYQVEKSLYEAIKETKASSASAIILETATGRVLAMANMPDFNPNNYAAYVNNFGHKTYYNRAIGDSYEPGSTFKLITIATALQHNKILPNEIMNCEDGSYRIGNKIIHDTISNSWLDIKNIVKKSSNICAAKIGLRIPKTIFFKTIKEFGFGSKTGINLPGEQTGKIINYQAWTNLTIATISYGYSISVTPIQLVTAVNVIANGGKYISPYLVDRILTNQEVFRGSEHQVQRSILRKEVVDSMTRYMISVTEKGGTGYSARIKGIHVAGKSGTARKVGENNRYSTTRHQVSFVGFLPADSPELTIIVVLNEPEKNSQGVKSAAPTFKKVAAQSLENYRENKSHKIQIRNSNVRSIFESRNIDLSGTWKGLTLREAIHKATKENKKLLFSGTGVIQEKKDLDSSTIYIQLRHE